MLSPAPESHHPFSTKVQNGNDLYCQASENASNWQLMPTLSIIVRQGKLSKPELTTGVSKCLPAQCNAKYLMLGLMLAFWHYSDNIGKYLRSSKIPFSGCDIRFTGSQTEYKCSNICNWGHSSYKSIRYQMQFGQYCAFGAGASLTDQLTPVASRTSCCVGGASQLSLQNRVIV